MSQFSQVPRIAYRAKFALTRQFPEVPTYATQLTRTSDRTSDRTSNRTLRRPNRIKFRPAAERHNKLYSKPLTPSKSWLLYVAVVAPRQNARLWKSRRYIPDKYIGDTEKKGPSAQAYQFALNKDIATYDVDSAYRWCVRKIGFGGGKGSWECYARDAAQDGYLRWVKMGGKVNPKTCVRSALIDLVRREGISQKIFTPLELVTVEPIEREDKGPGFKLSQLPESLRWVANQIAEGRTSEDIRKEMRVGKETVNRMRRQIADALETLIK